MDNNNSNLYYQKLNILYYIVGFVVKTFSPSFLYFLQKKQTDHEYGHNHYTKIIDINKH